MKTIVEAIDWRQAKARHVRIVCQVYDVFELQSKRSKDTLDKLYWKVWNLSKYGGETYDKVSQVLAAQIDKPTPQHYTEACNVLGISPVTA